jgi:hypothetical protein
MLEDHYQGAGLSFQFFVGARPETIACGTSGDCTFLLQQDPIAAANLETAVEGYAGLRVIAATIGSVAGEASLNLMNMVELSSLRQPNSALLDQFPGLKKVAVRQVRIIRVADLDTPIATAPSLCSWRLRIDMPGSELDILNCNGEAGLLTKASQCVVRCSSIVFFQGGCDYEAVADLLARKGFDQTSHDPIGPGWAVLGFRRNPQTQQVALTCTADFETVPAKVHTETEVGADRDVALFLLRRENKSKAKPIIEVDPILAAENATSGKSALELGEVVFSVEAEYDEVRGEVRAHSAAMKDIQEPSAQDVARTSQHDAPSFDACTLTKCMYRTVTEQLSAGVKQADPEQLRTMVAAKDAELAELRSELSGLRVLFREMEAERDNLLENAAAHTDAIQALEATAEERKTRIDFLETENRRVTELQADVGFQIRMNALVRGDLDELADRFEQTEKRRMRLEELLRTLTQKLQLAAGQLHLLQASTLSKADVANLPGEPKPKRGRRRGSG